MIVLDAGVLIGLLDGADAHHRAAVTLFEEQRAPFVVHELTLAEVLVGPARLGCEHDVWSDLQAVGVRLADLDVEEYVMLLARLRARSGLKMPDACVLATAEALDCKLVTFDKQLAAAASKAQRLLA